jgi:hypothetical protein
VNYGIGRVKSWGLRLPLGLTRIPIILLTLGSIFLVETRNSLVERGCNVPFWDIIILQSVMPTRVAR